MDQELQHQKQILSFIERIETIRVEGKLSYMDAIVDYCEMNEVDIETIAQFIKEVPKLKACIEQEAEDLNYFEKTARLPV